MLTRPVQTLGYLQLASTAKFPFPYCLDNKFARATWLTTSLVWIRCTQPSLVWLSLSLWTGLLFMSTRDEYDEIASIGQTVNDQVDDEEKDQGMRNRTRS